MRKIKFRGLRKNGKGWAYGFYMDGSETGSRSACIINASGIEFTGSMAEIDVIPETVGKFIGVVDEDGKEVYDGDILETPKGLKMTVQWNKTGFGVKIKSDKDGKYYHRTLLSNKGRCYAKVIGNTHKK